MDGTEGGAVPVHGYDRVPGLPPVTVTRMTHGADGGHARYATPHAHDFLVLAYFDAGHGELRLDGRAVRVRAGDVVVVAPREVVAPAWTGGDDATAWSVSFPPDAVERSHPGTLRPWRAHPLLFPFVGSRAGGAQRLSVPEADRAAWSHGFAGLDRELRERRDGWGEAALARLILLLVDLARLAAAADVPESLRLRDEPLLAAVFDVVERRFAEPVSLREVAAEVGLTGGHLTTMVRRRTGRTVQQWLTERRMAEARRLLTGTDLTLQAIATRVGYRDAGYLVRRFRAAHGLPPQEWRRAGRPR